eukprot:6189191-Alexandrium_andersonii.AAC.1
MQHPLHNRAANVRLRGKRLAGEQASLDRRVGDPFNRPIGQRGSVEKEGGAAADRDEGAHPEDDK